MTKKLRKIFERFPQLKLVYFFGSRAKKRAGVLSDYDFGVYIDEKNPKKIFEIKVKLMDELSRFFKTDKIDIVVLNWAESPELKYHIIKEGKLIFEKEPFKVLVEPKILNEYFDFRYQLLKYNLTKN